MTFGDKLYRWRKAKGLTQQELASATGVNVSYISNLERDFSATTKSGKPRPSQHLCDKLAGALDVSLDEVRLAAGYAPSNVEDPLAGLWHEATAKYQRESLTDTDLEEIREDIRFAVAFALERRRNKQQ